MVIAIKYFHKWTVHLWLSNYNYNHRIFIIVIIEFLKDNAEFKWSYIALSVTITNNVQR